MNLHKGILPLVATWLTVLVAAWWSAQTIQEDEPTLESLKQRLQERAEYVAEMSFLIKMIRDTELQTELEIVPDQITEMKQLVAEFQQSQIEYTMKNGDRQQTLNRLINEKKVIEATALSNEMFSEFDQTMLSLHRQVETSILYRTN